MAVPNKSVALPAGVEWWRIENNPGTLPELNVQVRVCGTRAIARYGIGEFFTKEVRAKAIRALAVVRRGKVPHVPLTITQHKLPDALTFEGWYAGTHDMVNDLGEKGFRVGADRSGRACVPAEDFSDPELWGPGAGRVLSPLLAGDDPLSQVRNACWHVRNARPELELHGAALDDLAVVVRKLLDGGVTVRQIVGAIASGLVPGH